MNKTMNLIHQDLSIVETIALTALVLTGLAALLAVSCNLHGLKRYFRIRRM
jgi:hypothetical protein